MDKTIIRGRLAPSFHRSLDFTLQKSAPRVMYDISHQSITEQMTDQPPPTKQNGGGGGNHLAYEDTEENINQRTNEPTNQPIDRRTFIQPTGQPFSTIARPKLNHDTQTCI